MKKVKLILAIMIMFLIIGGTVASANDEGIVHFRVKSADLNEQEIGLMASSFLPLEGEVRMRKKPGLNGIILGLLYPGDHLYAGTYDRENIVYADGYSWILVTRSRDGLSGWVALDFLEEIG